MKQKKGSSKEKDPKAKNKKKKASGTKKKVEKFDFSQNTVEPNMPVIKQYDFRKPKTFTKEHLRGLNTVNEHIVRVFASNLSGLLRVFCEVSQLKLIECRYSEYLQTLPDKTLISFIDINDEATSDNKCTMMAYFPAEFDFFMIDILLGGMGLNYNLDRGFTDIEIAILENFYRKITDYLTEAWKNLDDLKCEMSGYETNPRLAQFISLDDSVVVMSFNLKVRDISEVFSFCLPAVNLEAILHDASKKSAKTNQTKTEAEKDALRREQLEGSLQGSTVELTAVLDNLYIDMQDIVNLKVSDVIPLSKRIDDNIVLTVEGEPKFACRVGDRRIKKSVKICGTVSDSEINEFYKNF